MIVIEPTPRRTSTAPKSGTRGPFPVFGSFVDDVEDEVVVDVLVDAALLVVEVAFAGVLVVLEVVLEVVLVVVELAVVEVAAVAVIGLTLKSLKPNGIGVKVLPPSLAVTPTSVACREDQATDWSSTHVVPLVL